MKKTKVTNSELTQRIPAEVQACGQMLIWGGITWR